MKHPKMIILLVTVITVLASLAAALGIFSKGGPGPYSYESIRGVSVPIHGIGLYRDMSAEVAPQGIAQDFVTLFIAIPLLLISLLYALKGSLKAAFLLTGTLGYFLVTYLFYLCMGMFNSMFLAYVGILSASFFAFLLAMDSIPVKELKQYFSHSTPVKIAGGFLIFNAFAIALLWLSIVLPPLLDRSIVPLEVEHYTTLIVQGLDLAILLPAAFICGYWLMKKHPNGYRFGTVYFIFLSLLMTALVAKIIAMSILGYNIIPAVFIIPVFAMTAIVFSIAFIKCINKKNVKTEIAEIA